MLAVFSPGQHGPESVWHLQAKAQRAIARARLHQAATKLLLKNPPEMENPGYTFLITDSKLGMTFARIALHAIEGSQKRMRNQANARRAYDGISRMSHCRFLSRRQRDDVDSKLAQLRSALNDLGEVFL
jgi:uncharacterized protein involved in type VI secretion and phage assembly